MIEGMNKPMLTWVLEDLDRCRGRWAEIARELEPDNFVSFYSWLTKLGQGVIREPSVNRIQRLFDYFESSRARPTSDRHSLDRIAQPEIPSDTG